MLLKEIKQIVKGLDEELEPSHDYFKTAVLLLAMMEYGDDEDRLVKFTKLPRNFVRLRLERVLSQGIYKDGQIQADWMDDEHGSIGFWCDVATAEGLLNRLPDDGANDDNVLNASEVG